MCGVGGVVVVEVVEERLVDRDGKHTGRLDLLHSCRESG